MPRTANWPSREEWAAKAEHYVRTQCYTWQRVSTEPSDWLTPAELAEARALAVAIVKATRTALTRAGRGNERSDLNAHGREAAQDWNDAMDLYRILEDEVVPAFFEREGGAGSPPARWIERMRRSMASTLWQFSTTRMLHEYTERLYLPAAGIEPARIEADEAEAEAPSS